MTTRLSEATLAGLPAHVARPAYDRAATRLGVAHFGPGAFHRAHQAAYLDSILRTDPRWAISAVSMHSTGVRDALRPQDGLYTLATLDQDTGFRVLGAHREVLVAPENPSAVLGRLAHPDVEVVTSTVTEKGYCLTPAGDLDEDHPDIQADLASPAAPASFPGWVVAGLRARRAAGLPPLTVIACDNLTDNGVKLKAAVVQLARATDRGLADWIDAEAAFPRTMVDSITPATDDALRGRVARELGLHDAWPIQREAFTQWVIERDDRARGPDWVSVGVDMTTDVRGYETCKLRLLNGAHSSLAYLGLLRGHALVRDAMADPELAAFVRALMVEAVRPTLRPPSGFDVDAYIEAVLARFRTPAIGHQLSQIAWDGSQKLPFRLMGTVADLLAMGRPVDLPAQGPAAWMHFVVRQAKAGVALTDPLAGRLAELGRACTGDAAADVTRLAPVIVPPELLAHPVLRRALEHAYAALA